VSRLALVQLKVSVNDSWLDNRVLRRGSHTDYRHGAGSVRAPGSCRAGIQEFGYKHKPMVEIVYGLRRLCGPGN